MRTLKIQVNDKDYKRVKAFLAALKTTSVLSDKKNKKAAPISLVSEKALAEDWLSVEDSRYELYFKK